jgi:hypothetical protein
MKAWRTGADGKPERFEPDELKPSDAAWDYVWGACDECGMPSDTYLTDKDWNHYAICERCKTRWPLGRNLFSIPFGEDEEDVLVDDVIIGLYREVSGDAPDWAVKVMDRSRRRGD